MANPDPVPAQSSATVVMLRATPVGGFEVLLMRRHAAMDVHGDAWVFPGGRVQVDDIGPGTEIDVARRAAVREVAEEVSIGLDPNVLVPLAHWTTPTGFPKRFATWFFLAEVDASTTPLVDGVEAVAAEWRTPADALALADPTVPVLAPPQIVTLEWLRSFPDAPSAVRAARTRLPVWFTPRVARADDGTRVTLYEGDVVYRDVDPDLARPGPRHRLSVVAGRWRYEQTP